MKSNQMVPYRKESINNADGAKTSSSNFGNLLTNLADTISPGGGIKTDVSITLSPSNFIYMGLAVFVAVLAVLVVNKILGELLFNSK